MATSRPLSAINLRRREFVADIGNRIKIAHRLNPNLTRIISIVLYVHITIRIRYFVEKNEIKFLFIFFYTVIAR